MTLSFNPLLTGYLLPRLMAGQTVASGLLDHALNPTPSRLFPDDVFHMMLHPPAPASSLSIDFPLLPLFRPMPFLAASAVSGGDDQATLSAVGGGKPPSPSNRAPSGQIAGEIERLLEKIQRQITENGGPKAATLCSLGAAYTKAGRFEDARQAFEWSRRLSTHSRTCCELSILYRKMGRLQDSLAAIDDAIRLDPHQGRYLCEKGITLREMGHLQDSLTAIDDAIRLDPHQGRSLCEKGITLKEMGRLQEALSAWNESIRINDTQGLLYPTASLFLAMSLSDLNQHEKALLVIEGVVKRLESVDEIPAGLYEPHALFALLLARSKKWDASETALLKAQNLGAPKKLLASLENALKATSKKSRLSQFMEETKKDAAAILRGLSAHRSKALGRIWHGRIHDPLHFREPRETEE